MTTELDPAWTEEELSSIRDGLAVAAERLRAEIAILGAATTLVASSARPELLHDDLDVAAHHSELMQDAVQAQNAAAILDQTEHVLARLELGLYGVCEQCSASIGRPRLEAFPRATLCMACVA